MARVLTCIDPQPALDGSCAQTAWLEFPSVLPPLTVSEGLQISGAIIGLWVLAYCLRLVKDQVWR